MANSNAPFGLSTIGVGGGAAPNFELITAKIASNDTQACYHQDPVKLLSTGYVTQWTAGTAASQFFGVLQSVKYFSVSQGKVVSMPYWPGSDASGDVTAYLVPVQLAVPPKFIIQSSGSAITQADVGLNGDLSMGTGSTVGGCFSGATINQATLNTTSTFPLRIVGLYEGATGAPGSDAASSYNWVIVTANVYQNTGV